MTTYKKIHIAIFAILIFCIISGTSIIVLMETDSKNLQTNIWLNIFLELCIAYFVTCLFYVIQNYISRKIKLKRINRVISAGLTVIITSINNNIRILYITFVNNDDSAKFPHGIDLIKLNNNLKLNTHVVCVKKESVDSPFYHPTTKEIIIDMLEDLINCSTNLLNNYIDYLDPKIIDELIKIKFGTTLNMLKILLKHGEPEFNNFNSDYYNFNDKNIGTSKGIE